MFKASLVAGVSMASKLSTAFLVSLNVQAISVSFQVFSLSHLLNFFINRLIPKNAPTPIPAYLRNLPIQ